MLYSSESAHWNIAMPLRPHHTQRFSPNCPSSRRDGFALIIALGLMAFVLLLLLSITTFIQVESTNSARTINKLKARQNALLSLNIAVGQLQRYAGPDQRVSANAKISFSNTGNPQWTGIWDARPDPSDPTILTHASAPTTDAPIIWLVNGAEDTANSPLTPDLAAVPDPAPNNSSVWLAKSVRGEELPTSQQIKLETSAIAGNNSNDTGHYAYWVDDIGVKASIMLTPETPNPSAGSHDKFKQLVNAPTYGAELISGLSTVFSKVNDDASDDDANHVRSQITRVTSYEDLSLLETSGTAILNTDLANLFGDVSPTTSYGVLADTMRGGLRRDLTYSLTENVAPSQAPGLSEIGADALIPFGNKDINNLDRYPDPGPVGQISPTQTWTDLEEPPTPTWDYVRSFYSNRATSYGTIDPVASPFPILDTWNIDTSSEHAILPIITMIEFRYGIDIESTNYHYTIEPNIVLCNPYNVTLNLADYTIRFSPSKPDGPTVKFIIREGSSTTDIDTLSFADQLGSRELAFNVSDSFEPGEVKVYSVPNDILYTDSAEGVIDLSPGYSAASILIDSGEAILVTDPTKSYVEFSSAEQIHPTMSLSLGSSSPGNFASKSITNRFLEMEQTQMNVTRDSVTGNKVRPKAKMDGTVETRGILTFRFSMVTPTTNYLNSGNQGGSQNHRVPDGHIARNGSGTKSTKTEGMRNLIDSNPRATIGQRLGGWDNAPTYSFSSFRYAHYTAPVAFDLTHAFWGGSIEGDGNGTSEVVLFDIPREDDPLISIGQLASVNWGIGAKHPAYPLGNSYASIFYYHDTPDMSYALNEALWDRFYFSSLPSTNLENRPAQLDNSRLIYYDPTGETDLSALEGIDAYENAAERLLIKGSFNINSTSVEAWTAFLGGIPRQSYSYTSPSGATENDNAVRPYLRLRNGHQRNPINNPNQLYEWSGYRELTDSELKGIAQAVVTGIQTRGRPARSLAEFLNRDLNFAATDIRNQKGILQSAIDSVVNQDDPTAGDDGANNLSNLPGILGASSIGNALIVEGTFESADNPDAAAGKLRATGAPGFVMQNDIITPCAPAMSARSDSFRIRTYGDVRDPITGKTTSRIWCEAYVQRVPDYLGGEDPSTPIADLPANSSSERFGRKFVITKTRWLSEQDI